MQPEKPYKITKVKSSKGTHEYTICHYETFDTCTCKAYELKQTCKHIKEYYLKQEKGG